MISVMSGSGQKRLFLKFPWFRSAPLRSCGDPAADPTASWGKAALGPPFCLWLIDLFNDRPFTRLNHICPVVALDIAIVPQCRGFPIDLLGEGSDLHGLRQPFPNPDPSGGGGATRGALFYPRRPSMFADDLPIPVGKGCLVRRRSRGRGRRGRSARAR